MKWLQRWCVLVLISGSTVSMHGEATARGASGEEVLKERFLKEAPQGWAALAAAYSRVDLLGVETDSKTGSLADGKKGRIKSFRYASDGPSSLLYAFRVDGFAECYVECINPRYGFILGEQGKAGKSTVRYYGPERKSISKEIADTIDRYIMAPYSSHAMEYSVMMNDPGFMIRKIAEVPGNNGSIRLEFAFMSGNPKWPNIPEGWAIFDPTHSWSLQEAHVIMANRAPYHMATKVAYDPDQRGPIPSIRSVEYVNYSKSLEDGAVTYRCDFPQFKLSPPPPADFRMTAFGMPELADIPGDGVSKTRPELWLLGLGIALGVGAIVVRIRSRRAA